MLDLTFPYLFPKPGDCQLAVTDMDTDAVDR